MKYKIIAYLRQMFWCSRYRASL